MSQALYRKWRPNKWEEVVGQQHVVRTLHNAVASGRVGHAYLFAGPRGTGKTTVARILAKAVNCLEDDLAARPCDQCAHCQSVNNGVFLDLIEIDAASNTSVEDVRDLRDKINFSPNQGRYKVYIIDEVHMLSTAAFNALLKTLEEPPSHAIFVLATTEVHKIPATVLSRCQRHEFRRIPVREIVAQLDQVVAGEDFKVQPEALALVARQATGSLRDAISLLDQLSVVEGEITLALAQNILGTATSQSVLDVVDALLSQDAAAGLKVIHATLDAGGDPRQFTRQLVEYLRSVLLVRMGNAEHVDTTNEGRQVMARHAQAFEEAQLLRTIRVFNQVAVELRMSWQPSLPLELAFLEAIAEPSPQPVVEKNPSSPSTPMQKPPPAASRPKTEAPSESNKPADSPNQADAAGKLNRQDWQKIIKLVKAQSPTTTGLLNSCRSKEFDKGILRLGFASDLLCQKMAQEEHASLVIKAASQVLGEPVELQCIISAGNAGALPPEVDASGMVATGMRLGGEIVDVQDLKKAKDEGDQG